MSDCDGMVIVETWYYDEQGTYLLGFQRVDEWRGHRTISDHPTFEVSLDTYTRWLNAEFAFNRAQQEINDHLTKAGGEVWK